MITYQMGGPDPSKPYDNMALVYDDEARTVTDYRSGEPVVTPYSDEAAAAAAQVDADEAAQAAAQAVSAQLIADQAADLAKVDAVLASTELLLADNTVAGSVRNWKSTVSSPPTAAQVKALGDLVRDIARNQRRLARMVKRNMKVTTGTLDTADVGSDLS